MFIPCAIGYGQILIIAVIVLILFGGSKIPELMRGVGRGVREFKDAMNTDYSKEEGQKEGQKESPKEASKETSKETEKKADKEDRKA